MRDIDTLPLLDDAYTAPSPAGLPVSTVEDPVETIEEDPSFSDTVAYGMPSLGGEFGPGMVPLLSGPADGGEALLEAGATYTAPPALVIPTPASALAGRAMNASIRTNLYPWFATPPAGLSSNRSSTPPVVEDPPPAEDPPVTLSAVTLTNGNVSFGVSGRARADAVVHLHYVVNGDLRSLNVNVEEDASATSIATAIRAALRTDADLLVSGTGGQVAVYASAPTKHITDFEITIERD